MGCVVCWLLRAAIAEVAKVVTPDPPILRGLAGCDTGAGGVDTCHQPVQHGPAWVVRVLDEEQQLAGSRRKSRPAQVWAVVTAVPAVAGGNQAVLVKGTTLEVNARPTRTGKSPQVRWLPNVVWHFTQRPSTPKGRSDNQREALLSRS